MILLSKTSLSSSSTVKANTRRRIEKNAVEEGRRGRGGEGRNDAYSMVNPRHFFTYFSSFALKNISSHMKWNKKIARSGLNEAGGQDESGSKSSEAEKEGGRGPSRQGTLHFFSLVPGPPLQAKAVGGLQSQKSLRRPSLRPIQFCAQGPHPSPARPSPTGPGPAAAAAPGTRRSLLGLAPNVPSVKTGLQRRMKQQPGKNHFAHRLPRRISLVKSSVQKFTP